MKKLKDDKAIVGLEVIFAMIIIIAIVSICTIIGAKSRYESKKIKCNIEASMIATNIIENMNSKTYKEFKEYISTVSMVGMKKNIIGDAQYITVNGGTKDEFFFGTIIPEGYIVELKIDNTNTKFNIIQDITITIKYKVAEKEEKYQIKTAIEFDIVNECNKPVIQDEYFKSFGITSENYDIIPIKYSQEKKAYITTNVNDKYWYNYSAKDWARVLIFVKDADGIESKFIDNSGVVQDSIVYDNVQLNIENYMYVWIPNFTIVNDQTYFRYKATKKVIKPSVITKENQHLYGNVVAEEANDISEECSFDRVNGVWRSVKDVNDDYLMNFNLTKYAPLNQHK